MGVTGIARNAGEESLRDISRPYRVAPIVVREIATYYTQWSSEVGGGHDMSGAQSGPARFFRYTSEESRADLIVHGFGVALAAVALPWMVWSGFVRAGSVVGCALVPYAVGVVLMLGSSALYNLTWEPGRKELLRRIDRAVIFVMIAGTYSPLALVLLDPPWRAGLMAFEWGLAGLGMTLALALPRRSERLCILLYLLMGWAVIPVLGPLTAAMGPSMTGLIVVGAVIYTAGVGFHAAIGLKFHNVIWHCCVLAAATCHYVAIFTAVVLAGPR